MKMIKNKWVSLPAIGVILLAFLQFGYAWYTHVQERDYVARISGVAVTPLMDNGLEIRWGDNTTPPSCPVTLDFLWEHESGFAIVEQPEITFTETEHYAIAKGKTGHISWEPVDPSVVELIKQRPGEWHYKILFKFNCNLLDIDYLSWINFEQVHIAKPVVINV